MQQFSLADLNRESLPPMVVLPAGTELNLTLSSVTVRRGKEKDTPYLLTSWDYAELLDGAEVQTIFHTLFLPDASNQTVKQQNQAIRDLSAFADKTGIDYDQFCEWIEASVGEPEDARKFPFTNLTAYVTLGEDTYKGKKINTIVAFN